jgi:hypothetical protein
MRRSTMSIALCQSSTSASLMWANTPRLDASSTNLWSGEWSRTITGQAASRTISRAITSWLSATTIGATSARRSSRSFAIRNAEVVGLETAHRRSRHH